MSVSPLKPSQVDDEKNLRIPDEVIEVFNSLIVENWNGHSSTITQSEAVSRIEAVLDIPRQRCFDLGYLDVEDLYCKEGWEVVYDKPGYCETYAATFTFTKKR